MNDPNSSTPSFDIFRIEERGELLWIEAAETLDGALLRLAQLGRLQAAGYLIRSQQTGAQISVIAEDLVITGANYRSQSAPSPTEIHREASRISKTNQTFVVP
jgi:hypothetical protein